MLSAEARQLVHTLRYNDEFNLSRNENPVPLGRGCYSEAPVCSKNALACPAL
jgi:hypothetical protein